MSVQVLILKLPNCMLLLPNIDWLEVFCIEDPKLMNAEEFLKRGYIWRPREYGTRIYEQVIEVRNVFGVNLYTICRVPKSCKSTSANGILPEGACHIKLENWLLYNEDYVQNLQGFLSQFNIEFRSISRLDVCADLQYFKFGLKPYTLLRGYMEQKYYKVKQSEFAVHGRDTGYINMQSIKFGSMSSNIFTRMYNKSLELKQVKDKPYIRDCWQAVGFEKDKDVWRVEVSLKGNGRHLYDRTRKCWADVTDPETGEMKTIVVGANEKPKGEVKYRKILNVEIDLDYINNREKVHKLFLSLVSTYFRFRKAVGTRRKSDCPLVDLFDSYPGSRPLTQLPTTHSTQSSRTDRQVVRYLHKQMTSEPLLTDDDRNWLNGALHTIVWNKRLAQWWDKEFCSLPYPDST